MDGLHFDFAERLRTGEAELRSLELAIGEVTGQVVDRDGELVGEDGGMFDNVGEFADVAGPDMGAKGFEGFVGE